MIQQTATGDCEQPVEARSRGIVRAFVPIRPLAGAVRRIRFAHPAAGATVRQNPYNYSADAG